MNRWASVAQGTRIHQVGVVPDRTRVGIQFDIEHTGRGVGFLEEVLARVRETPTRHYMCHTVNVYVDYIVVKIIWDVKCSSSFTDKHLHSTSPNQKGQAG